MLDALAFLFALLIFAAAMAFCLLRGVTLIAAVAIGLLAFSAAACRGGCRLAAVLRAALEGVRETAGVARVLLLIGCLTAAWRMSGVIAFFVYFGVRQIAPELFLLLAFALASLISYALGTCIGTAGTAGVILMAIARAGGIDPLLAAGAICAGAYFGDRTSPVASTANLMAELTHTDLYGNVRRMLKTSILPMAFCIVIYGIQSLCNPLRAVDPAILQTISADFRISAWQLLPVAVMLLLPLLRVKVRAAIACSALSACVLAVALQGERVPAVLRACLLGYRPAASAMAEVWAGGGAASMLEIIAVLLIAGTYAPILKAAGAMALLDEQVEKLMHRCGRSISLVVCSLLCVGIFCSQLVACMMMETLMEEPYRRRGLSQEELALDLQNSVVVLSPAVPWGLACSVPLRLLNVGAEAVLHNYLIFAIPLFYFVGKALKNRRQAHPTVCK